MIEQNFGKENIQAEPAPGAQTERPPVIVDLRDAEDYARGHIPGAVHIPMENLRDEIRRIATFSTPILLYCYAGARSEMAEALLRARGYTQAKSIGGLAEYTGELVPSEEVPAPPKEPVRALTIRELRTSLKLSQAAFGRTLGVEAATISAYETGKVRPSRKIRERIRNTYQIEIEG